MMPIAQRYGELIRYLEAERARLSEADVVRLSRSATAHQARFVRYEGEVSLVAHALFLGEGELTGRLRGAGRKNVEGLRACEAFRAGVAVMQFKRLRRR